MTANNKNGWILWGVLAAFVVLTLIVIVLRMLLRGDSLQHVP